MQYQLTRSVSRSTRCNAFTSMAWIWVKIRRGNRSKFDDPPAVRPPAPPALLSLLLSRWPLLLLWWWLDRELPLGNTHNSIKVAIRWLKSNECSAISWMYASHNNWSTISTLWRCCHGTATYTLNWKMLPTGAMAANALNPSPELPRISLAGQMYNWAKFWSSASWALSKIDTTPSRPNAASKDGCNWPWLAAKDRAVK